jgi:hypothetical protein
MRSKENSMTVIHRVTLYRDNPERETFYYDAFSYNLTESIKIVLNKVHQPHTVSSVTFFKSDGWEDRSDAYAIDVVYITEPTDYVDNSPTGDKIIHTVRMYVFSYQGTLDPEILKSNYKYL